MLIIKIFIQESLVFLVGISKENLGWWSNGFGNSCVIKNVVNLDNESTHGLRNYYIDGVTRTHKAPPPKEMATSLLVSGKEVFNSGQ